MPKDKFPRAEASNVAQDICDQLFPWCERIAIAGSLRRGLPEVGDIEIVYIPKTQREQVDLLGEEFKDVNLADKYIDGMLSKGALSKRKSADDRECWGQKNKLAVHVESGIPVDFFSTTPANWWVTLLIRTGGKQTNLQITTAANRIGYSLEAYGCGFRSMDGRNRLIEMTSEEQIFRFVGLPFLPPSRRK